jgi:hypothetical protein
MPTTGPSVLSLIASSTPHHQISLQASEDAINGNTDGPFNHEKQSPWQLDIVILSFSIVHPDSKYDSMGNPNHRGQPRSSFSHTVPLSSQGLDYLVVIPSRWPSLRLPQTMQSNSTPIARGRRRLSRPLAIATRLLD